MSGLRVFVHRTCQECPIGQKQKQHTKKINPESVAEAQHAGVSTPRLTSSNSTGRAKLKCSAQAHISPLRSSASHGPVIIINHRRWRSDILIILGDSPPSLITTPDNFFDRANALKDQLLDVRKARGLDSEEYEHTLGSVLADLYQLVGQPVVNRLHELRIPEQSRIWWCPTSVFCSLPLHAMGPVPSDDNVKQYFSDLYISSYTPSLSALIESLGPRSHTQVSPPSLLLIAPDVSLPGLRGEIDLIQGLDMQVTSLVSKEATRATVMDGLRHHQLVHFACHGTLALENGNPFDASFKLHGDEPLTLLDIVRSRIPSAEFAFLSACHTAELTDKSIAEEGLHLATAMQYCGFRSVVGAMWAMVDTDREDLAKHFYPLMLSGEWGEARYYERSARALRDAVQKLRRKRGVKLQRWACTLAVTWCIRILANAVMIAHSVTVIM